MDYRIIVYLQSKIIIQCLNHYNTAKRLRISSMLILSLEDTTLTQINPLVASQLLPAFDNYLYNEVPSY